ncbi:hypothetical protein Bca4012_019299 [Brassica carinata]
MKVINGQSLSERQGGSTPTYSQKSDHIRLHISYFRGPLINVYLWDQAAQELYSKFNESLATPAVVLVTAFNTKRTGGKPEVLSKGEQVSAEGMLLMSRRRQGVVYIPCTDCHAKANRGTASLMCPKCRDVNTVVKYLSTTMAGRQLLCSLVILANGDMCANHEMPTPQCLLEVSSYNFTVKRRP